MYRRVILAFTAMIAAASPADLAALPKDVIVVPGSSLAGRQPDGNSILLDTPKGLILVDTGRHTAHQDAILSAAKLRGKPIIAIINTHWHLDHSGGNAEIRSAFPGVPLYASNAINGALIGFLRDSRAEAEDYLRSGKASAELAEDIRLDMSAVDDPASLRPSIAVAADATRTIGGRSVEVNLAPFAATEGDVWLFDRKTRVLVAGDLVVAAAPYLDTACPEGWRKALDRIATRKFRILIPGHGAPMTRNQFLDWQKAFNALLDCAAGPAANADCIAGWKRDAAAFIPGGAKNVDGLLAYYLETRLRAPPTERNRYCPVS